MKQVLNTQLNRNIQYEINESKYAEFLVSIREYKTLLDELDKGYGGYVENINSTSYIVHMLAKKTSIGTNTIEKVIVDEGLIERELISRSKDIENRDKITTVINFLHEYKNIGKIDWSNLKNEISLIHKNIFKGTKGKKPGKFKKEVNYIPDQKIFLAPELVDEELNKLGSFVNNSGFEAIVIAAIAHAKFIEIHPFSDGNGRMGRLLSNKIIEEFYEVPLWIDESMSKTLTTYISALDAFSFDSNASEIINYFIEMSIQQLRRNTILINEVADLANRLFETLKIKSEIAIFIATNKAVNISLLSSVFDIHRNTAKSILESAVEHGYMEKIEGDKVITYLVR